MVGRQSAKQGMVNEKLSGKLHLVSESKTYGGTVMWMASSASEPLSGGLPHIKRLQEGAAAAAMLDTIFATRL